MCYGYKKGKTQQQRNKNANIKVLARAGNRTRNVFNPVG